MAVLRSLQKKPKITTTTPSTCSCNPLRIDPEVLTKNVQLQFDCHTKPNNRPLDSHDYRKLQAKLITKFRHRYLWARWKQPNLCLSWWKIVIFMSMNTGGAKLTGKQGNLDLSTESIPNSMMLIKPQTLSWKIFSRANRKQNSPSSDWFIAHQKTKLKKEEQCKLKCIQSKHNVMTAPN